MITDFFLQSNWRQLLGVLVRRPLIATLVSVTFTYSSNGYVNRQSDSERSKSIGGCASKPRLVRSFQGFVSWRTVSLRVRGGERTVSPTTYKLSKISNLSPASGSCETRISEGLPSPGSIDTHPLRQHLTPPSSTWHQSVRSISRVSSPANAEAVLPSLDLIPVHRNSESLTG